MGTFIRRSNGNVLFFDVAETVTRNYDSQVTDHPIENGATITDHVIARPREVRVSALVSEASFAITSAAVLADDFSNVDVNDLLASSIRDTSVLPFGRGRVAVALAELTEIRDNREVFTLELSDESFPNMVFSSFSIPKDSDTGEALRISFTARQVIEVERRFIEVPSALFDAADQAASEAEAGAQQGENTSGNDRSALATAIDTAAVVVKDIGRIVTGM